MWENAFIFLNSYSFVCCTCIQLWDAWNLNVYFFSWSIVCLPVMCVRVSFGSCHVILWYVSFYFCMSGVKTRKGLLKTIGRIIIVNHRSKLCLEIANTYLYLRHKIKWEYNSIQNLYIITIIVKYHIIHIKSPNRNRTSSYEKDLQSDTHT